MLNALRDEMAKKKRVIAEQKSMVGPRKYFKRAELEQVSQDKLNINQTESKPLIYQKEIAVLQRDDDICQLSTEDINEGSKLSRSEVIRRLRERAYPITLFAEAPLESFKRLRRLEILEPEINRGFRNDFQEALEKVDRAYLNEILNTANEKHSQKVTVVAEDPLTIDDVQLLAKKLVPGGNNLEVNCKMVYQFIQLLLQLWGSRLNDRSDAEKMCVKGKLDSATYTQTNCYLKPLMKKLRRRSLPEDILESLSDIVIACLQRDYVKANDSYLQMAIGNAPWPIGVTMVGIHARTGREKIFSKHVAHVLNDETQRKYIQGLKRLITKCQTYFSAAPSKCVEYQAIPQS